MVFYSDNTAAIHPKVLSRLERANAERYAPSYGVDDLSRSVTRRLADCFGAGLAQFTSTGTGANVLGLAALGVEGGLIACPAIAHLRLDEERAVERALGCEIIPIETVDGLITPSQVQRAADIGPLAAVAISITTENGRVFPAERIEALARISHEVGAGFHVDGARLANAIARGVGIPTKEFFTLGIDTLTFSGTKNGALSAEVVLVRDGLTTEQRLAALARSCGQLQSKARFVAAQFEALLDDDLWITNATHANAAAREVAGILRQNGHEVLYEIDANEVFATLPRSLADHFLEQGVAERWDMEGTTRFVTSYLTDAGDLADLDHLLQMAGPTDR